MRGGDGGTLAVRTSVVAAGVALVALPSAFGIFPELARWPIATRLAITVLWVVVVILGLIVDSRRDARLDKVLATGERQRKQLRLRATDDILTALLTSRGPGLPDHYRFTVYVFEADTDLLLPVFPNPGGVDDIRAFSPGEGAAGAAYQRKSLVLVTGDAVSDGTWHLTPEQQAHWGHYRAVVATPIWVEEQPIGVLSAISKKNDRCFDEPAAQARLRELADVIGVVLVNVSEEG